MGSGVAVMASCPAGEGRASGYVCRLVIARFVRVCRFFNCWAQSGVAVLDGAFSSVGGFLWARQAAVGIGGLEVGVWRRTY